MVPLDRRALMKLGMSATAIASLPPSIARALSIPADVREGTIKDIDHVVILMQENRSFDHYFGTLNGARGFADRFPIPIANANEKPRPVWLQRFRADNHERLLAPYHLDTDAVFDIMRMEGTPHGWPDSQNAWDNGRMTAWPEEKTHRSMGFFKRSDIPYQFALADTFTLCDAYHCSIMSSTNPNRIFLWAGSNDPAGTHGGPILDNSHDSFPDKNYAMPAYSITSYAQRLQAAGVDWRIYKDMKDFFTNNPLVGIDAFRNSYLNSPGSDPELAKRALSTHTLEQMRADVLAEQLPQVSYVIAPATGSEHPGRSSPAQGAAFIASMLDALTANPKVWARTAVFVMFDENDGFFDHVPPPAVPSRTAQGDGELLGASTIDTSGEYHERPATGGAKTQDKTLMGRPYGLGARVPMFVISPWSRGGRINSEVFDHTSVIRFLEARFGVMEPNITPWRRAVCGDLTSAFDFTQANAAPFAANLPNPHPMAKRVATISYQIDPKPPQVNGDLAQESGGVRPSSPLPYDLECKATVNAGPKTIDILFKNTGQAAAVIHVYNRLDLGSAPRRYTVGVGKSLTGTWSLQHSEGEYDLWLLGPAGFHRQFKGTSQNAALANALNWHISQDTALLGGVNGVKVHSPAYPSHKAWEVSPSHQSTRWELGETNGWYDFILSHPDHPAFEYRLAGRCENGKVRSTDPAM